MIETLKRWWKNVKWLLNHPPTAHEEMPASEEVYCQYCGSANGITELSCDGIVLIFCLNCQKKVFDTVLLPKSTTTSGSSFYVQVGNPIKWEEFKAGNEAIKKKGKKNVSKPKCGKVQNSPDGL